MNTKLIYPLILVAGVACHHDAARTSQQQYETVQEGSASGVTSTISGPGESLPPITGTNADTTTAFTINPNLAGSAPAAQPAPNAMGSVPHEPLGGLSPFPGTPATAPVTSRPATQTPPTQVARPATPPMTRETPRPVTPPPPQQTETVTPPPPPPPQQTETEEPPPPPPQQTDTTTTTNAPENTDTANTDTTKTDTEEPPPPPPPPA